MHFCSYVFNTSLLETFAALTHGGTVCIPLEEARINDLAGAIVSMGVNWTLLTQSIVRLITPKLILGIKTVCLGGEPVRTDSVKTWAGTAEEHRLILAYRPTEATIGCSFHKVESVSDSPTILDQVIRSII